jgi:hypothetical protein
VGMQGMLLHVAATTVRYVHDYIYDANVLIGITQQLRFIRGARSTYSLTEITAQIPLAHRIKVQAETIDIYSPYQCFIRPSFRVGKAGGAHSLWVHRLLVQLS